MKQMKDRVKSMRVRNVGGLAVERSNRKMKTKNNENDKKGIKYRWGGSETGKQEKMSKKGDMDALNDA